MKILFFYQELPTPMYHWHRVHYIDELSHYGIEFDSLNPLLFDSVEEANNALLKRARQCKYDMFLSNTCYYKMLFIETLEEIKKMGIPTLTIAWDNLMAPYIDQVLAPHFDLVLLTAKETTRLYEKWGVNYFFAPYAANPYKYTYTPSQILRTVCFVGNPHGSRAFMINRLTENNLPISLFFGGRSRKENAASNELKYDIINPSTSETIINRFKFEEGQKLLWGSIINKLKGSTHVIDNPSLSCFPGLSHEKMVETYSSSALALASTSAGHTDVLKKPLPIINLRNFEIPMCGGIEICKFNEELANYFEEGKEMVFYRSEEELVEKARYYIEKASDSEINKIKNAARMRSETEHTWMKRFEMAFNILNIGKSASL